MGIKSFAMKKAMKWLSDNGDELVNKYGDKFIAQLFSTATMPDIMSMITGMSIGASVDDVMSIVTGATVKPKSGVNAKSKSKSLTSDVQASGTNTVQGTGDASLDNTGNNGNTGNNKADTPTRYAPSNAERLRYQLALPIAGDLVSMAGKGIGITQGALGSMFMAMANDRPTTAYSHHVPSSYYTGSALAGIGKTALGSLAQMAGDIVANRAYDIGADGWAQAQTDANRRFFIDHRPNNAQQEYEVQQLRRADRRSNNIQRSSK